MKKQEFWPCSGGKASHCSDCKIDQKGFCQKFCTFVKSRLLPYTKTEIEKEISHRTFEAIFKSIDNCENIRIFSAYCMSIFKHTKADIFRSNKHKFVKEKITYEHQMINEVMVSDMSEADQADESTIAPDKAALIIQAIDKLRDKAMNKDRCAEIILTWYFSLQEGLSQKEMAEQLNMKPNTFNQELSRCKDEITKLFST